MALEPLELSNHIQEFILKEAPQQSYLIDLARVIQVSEEILGTSEIGNKTLLYRLCSIDDIRVFMQDEGKNKAFLSISTARLNELIEIDRIYKLGVETEMYMRAVEESRAEAAKHRLRDVPGLSVRAIQALERSHIGYVEDVLTKTLDEIRILRNFGETSFKELIGCMTSLGYEVQLSDGRKPFITGGQIVTHLTEDELLRKNEPE